MAFFYRRHERVTQHQMRVLDVFVRVGGNDDTVLGEFLEFAAGHARETDGGQTARVCLLNRAHHVRRIAARANCNRHIAGV